MGGLLRRVRRRGTADAPGAKPAAGNGHAPAEETLAGEADVRIAYHRYGGELYGFALNALGDHQLAEDVVQETFIRAWRAADGFDAARATLRTWLFAIARNAVVDAVRRRSVRDRADRREQREPEPVRTDVFDHLLTRIELDEALLRLSDDQRQAVVEVYFLGRTCADLAAELGIPAATMRSRLYYGVRALRSILEENGWLAP
ncbi:sigma-70 family RNA polymerase sigma factor [Streptomyces ochraceiscleroticus]|uniref:RNA polymerase sigma factor n=1 Tax=Streptomyces ochraceiscleroticus TaxID=47761 RepID=A0ABW1MS19_9ACTN|nr:sigma-70 family RNA polymerase sigma factor [Streptomyces ochraceiscleroticus]